MSISKLKAIPTILIILTNFIYSQSGMQDIQLITSPTNKTIEYYYDESGCPWPTVDDGWRTNSTWDIGYDSWQSYDGENECYNNHSRTYRTVYKIPLSGPSNGILKSVKIKASSNVNGNIVKFPEADYNSAYYIVYSLIAQGDFLMDFNSQLSDWEDITSYASDYLNEGQFCLGAIATESGNGNVTLQCQITWEYPVSFSVENSFGSGLIKVNGQNKSHGEDFEGWFGDSFTLEAIDNQTYNGYNYIFNNGEASSNLSTWDREGGSGSYSNNNQSITINLSSNDHNSTYIAKMKKECNADFENYFSGSSSSGTMTLNGQTRFSITVVENNAITATAQTWYTYDGIDYYFDHWTGGGTNRTKIFYPEQHADYTAYYVGKASFTNLESGLSFNSYSSNPKADNRVKLTWNEHSNTAVTKYAIWRKGKDGEGHNFDDGKIAEVNRGTTTYTDGDYLLTDGWTDATLQYAVTAYYSTEGTWSDLDYKTTYGEENSATKEMEKEDLAVNVIKEYSISNYPNPYNPATNIYYQLPVTGHVSIKVYDMLGREVTELVNSVKAPGRYEVKFDAGNLSSGTYIYQIIVNALNEGGRGYSASKKMLLIK